MPIVVEERQTEPASKRSGLLWLWALCLPLLTAVGLLAVAPSFGWRVQAGHVHLFAVNQAGSPDRPGYSFYPVYAHPRTAGSRAVMHIGVLRIGNWHWGWTTRNR